jgi:tetratricopeptide (TPR) repeat protein
MKTRLIILGLFFLCVLILAYANHFDNGFYFDDIHTIVNNEYIRDISNIPTFFTDLASFGTMPNNRGYRPIVTTLNAVDYLAGGNKLEPFYFHLSIFLWYIAQCVLMFIIFYKMFDIAFKHRWNSYIALFAAAYYALHTANAEAINYIIARSDTFSTFCIIATLALFQNKKIRQWHLYLIPAIVGVYTKETGIMVAPLLFFYVLLIEEHVSLRELVTFKKWSSIWKAIRSVIPAFVLLVGIFLFNRIYFTPHSNLFHNPMNRWDYFSSQWTVILSYLSNWILPLSLSADPDFKVTSGLFTSEKMYGLIAILALHLVAFFTSENKKTAPITFGLLWFFIALIPTSSLHPLVQVSNSHRMFFPYIGLALAVSWAFAMLCFKHEKFLTGKPWRITSVAVLFSVALMGYAYGTHVRNEVWDSGENLWYDVTVKSPKNGRGLMNYGLVKMRKGEYVEAEEYFTKALEFLPYWTYTNINMAVLKDAMGKKEEAIKYFELGLRYGKDNPEPYYYYARSMLKHGNTDKAMQMLEDGHHISPKHSSINQMRERLRLLGATPEEKLKKELELVASNPTSDNYINLSLTQYKLKDYQGCIEACQKALELNPKNAIAYNNICSSYNAMKNWQAAAAACKKALDIDPKFERARNNLKWAEDELTSK